MSSDTRKAACHDPGYRFAHPGHAPAMVDPIRKPQHHAARIRVRRHMPSLSHRQSEILNLARALGRVMVDDLARRCEVSAQTIRKDLNDLVEQRSLTRIHGGAIRSEERRVGKE